MGQARAEGRITGARFGSYASLFGEARWRKPALVRHAVVRGGRGGLVGHRLFQPGTGQRRHRQGAGGATRPGRANSRPADDVGGLDDDRAELRVPFLGMLTFTRLAQKYGRKKIFALSAVCAYVSTVVVFKFLTQPWQIFVFCPVMGFFQLALFAGFAIYLPELFPLRLRSTGTGFCYNVGRFVAASGPFTLGLLQLHLAPGASRRRKMEAFRNACCWVSSIYLLALLALPFLPETKGQPLPQKDDIIKAPPIFNTTLALLLLAGGGAAQAENLAFSANQAPIQIGEELDSVIAADVNGDGFVDLVTADIGGDTLTILTNTGSGIFLPGTNVTVGIGPACVTAADLNGDGKLGTGVRQ